jgi:hypothetical protein
MNKLLSIAALVAAPLAAQTATPPIAGVWAIGETRNCETGNAWVFHTDGYYAEVTLPDDGPKAVGMWRDDGATIAYTHSHMPFADMTKGAPARKFVVQRRDADRLVVRTHRGATLIFNRCPESAVKAAPGKAEH